VAAVQVQRERSVDFAGALELAGDAEKQFLSSILDPTATLDRLRNDLQEIRKRHALLEELTTFLQPFEGLDVRTSLKRPTVQGPLDLFVLEDPEVCGYEIRPALPMIAEEHEPESLAGRGHQQRVNHVHLTRPPIGKTSWPGELRREHRDQVRFTPGRVPARQPKTANQFRLGQDTLQPLDVEHRPVCDPPAFDQRNGGSPSVADLCVLKPACPEKIATPHDHSYKQRLGVPRHLGEFGDEPLFVRGKEIGVPGENGR
jgi:hypothetical protein